MLACEPIRYVVQRHEPTWCLWRERPTRRLDQWDGAAWVPAYQPDSDSQTVSQEAARELFPAAFATTGAEFAQGRAFARWQRASRSRSEFVAWGTAVLARTAALDALTAASARAHEATAIADRARAAADDWIRREASVCRKWIDASATMPERIAYLNAVYGEEFEREVEYGPDSAQAHLEEAEARTGEAFGAWVTASRGMAEYRAYRRATKRVSDDEAARFDAWQAASANMPEFLAWHESWQDRADKILAEQSWERASAGMPEYESYRRATRALSRADKAVTKADARALLGERQLHTGGGDAFAADHHRQIVQRAAGPEDALQCGRVHARVDLHALRGQTGQAGAALDHHQRAESVAAEELDGLVERVDERIEVAPLAGRDRLPQAHHRLAQLGLEHDHQEHRQGGSFAHHAQNVCGARGTRATLADVQTGQPAPRQPTGGDRAQQIAGQQRNQGQEGSGGHQDAIQNKDRQLRSSSLAISPGAAAKANQRGNCSTGIGTASSQASITMNGSSPRSSRRSARSRAGSIRRRSCRRG